MTYDSASAMLDKVADDLAPVFARNNWQYATTGPVTRDDIRHMLEGLYRSSLAGYGRAESGRLYVDAQDGGIQAGITYSHFEEGADG